MKDKTIKVKILVWWEDTEYIPDEFVFKDIEKYHPKVKKLIDWLYKK